MAKIHKLNEQDLVRLARRVIKENTEVKIADMIIDKLPENMVLNLGKILNNLGHEEFMNIAKQATQEALGGKIEEDENKNNRRERIYMDAFIAELISMVSLIPASILYFVKGKEGLSGLVVTLLALIASHGVKKLSGFKPKQKHGDSGGLM